MKAHLLAMPMPFLLGAVVPQVDEHLLQGAPGWVATAFLGVWVTLWFLDRVGKLPGRSEGDRRVHAFTTDDREMLRGLHRLFLHRDGEDGIERFPAFMRDRKAAEAEVASLLRQVNEKLNQLIDLQRERHP